MVRRGPWAERVVSPHLSSVIELSDGSDDEGTQRSPVAGPKRPIFEVGEVGLVLHLLQYLKSEAGRLSRIARTL